MSQSRARTISLAWCKGMESVFSDIHLSSLRRGYSMYSRFSLLDLSSKINCHTHQLFGFISQNSALLTPFGLLQHYFLKLIFIHLNGFWFPFSSINILWSTVAWILLKNSHSYPGQQVFTFILCITIAAFITFLHASYHEICKVYVPSRE